MVCGDLYKLVQVSGLPTESRFAMIEFEVLAACWAMQKCYMCLQGLHHFPLITDNQPFVPILNCMGISNVQITDFSDL